MDRIPDSGSDDMSSILIGCTKDKSKPVLGFSAFFVFPKQKNFIKRIKLYEKFGYVSFFVYFYRIEEQCLKSRDRDEEVNLIFRNAYCLYGVVGTYIWFTPYATADEDTWRIF